MFVITGNKELAHSGMFSHRGDETVKVLEEIANNVIGGDQTKIGESINRALGQGISPVEIIEKGMRRGIAIVGEKFENLELWEKKKRELERMGLDRIDQ